jgi:hypothetical protein
LINGLTEVVCTFICTTYDKPKMLMIGVKNAETTYFNCKFVGFYNNSLQH